VAEEADLETCIFEMAVLVKDGLGDYRNLDGYFDAVRLIMHIEFNRNLNLSMQSLQ